MSRKRVVLRYGAAGVVTTLFGLAVLRKWTHDDPAQGVSREKVAAVAASVVALTWVAALA